MVIGKDLSKKYTLKQTHNTHKKLPNQYHLKVLILSIVVYDGNAKIGEEYELNPYW